MFKKKRRFRKRGVPKGYLHDWKYRGRWRERKVAPGKWRFTFSSPKYRTKPARFHKGSPPKGTRIKWRIRATQTAKKVGRNTYMTVMRGSKRLVNIKRRR